MLTFAGTLSSASGDLLWALIRVLVVLAGLLVLVDPAEPAILVVGAGELHFQGDVCCASKWRFQ